MRLAGIIAEFNPLHNGHKYLINCAKSDGFAVACVISGNFVQRGDCAIIPKFKRAEMALDVGADLVCELPVPWSMSTAQNFALGGVSQLAAIGVDTIYFGSESGNFELLNTVSDLLLSKSFNNALKSKLESGQTYAKMRQSLVAEMISHEAAKVLENPNDTLGIEYISAAKKLNLNLNFKPIKRVGAGHNDSCENGGFSSSSYIRKRLVTKEFSNLSNIMPVEALNILENSPISDISKIDTAIISKIKQMSINEISKLPDISEGLENLIYTKARTELSYFSLCEAIKSKRYTLARIRRILLSAYLGITYEYFLTPPPYVRILGFNKVGSFFILESEDKPIITRVAQINELDDYSKKVFSLEMNINELYALSLNNPSEFTSEYKEKIIKK